MSEAGEEGGYSIFKLQQEIFASLQVALKSHSSCVVKTGLKAWTWKLHPSLGKLTYPPTHPLITTVPMRLRHRNIFLKTVYFVNSRNSREPVSSEQRAESICLELGVLLCWSLGGPVQGIRGYVVFVALICLGTNCKLVYEVSLLGGHLPRGEALPRELLHGNFLVISCKTKVSPVHQ